MFNVKNNMGGSNANFFFDQKKLYSWDLNQLKAGKEAEEGQDILQIWGKGKRSYRSQVARPSFPGHMVPHLQCWPQSPAQRRAVPRQVPQHMPPQTHTHTLPHTKVGKSSHHLLLQRMSFLCSSYQNCNSGIIWWMWTFWITIVFLESSTAHGI